MAKERKAFKNVSDELLIEELIRRIEDDRIVVTSEDYSETEGVVMFIVNGAMTGRYVEVSTKNMRKN